MFYEPIRVRSVGGPGGGCPVESAREVRPDDVVRSAGIVREGRLIRLARDLDPRTRRSAPKMFFHHMTRLGDQDRDKPHSFMDFVGIACHGKGITHLDVRSHISYRGGCTVESQVQTQSPPAERRTAESQSGARGPQAEPCLAISQSLRRRTLSRAVSSAEVSASLAGRELSIQPGDVVLFRFGRPSRDPASMPRPAIDAHAGLEPTAMADTCQAGAICWGSGSDAETRLSPVKDVRSTGSCDSSRRCRHRFGG